MNENVFDIKQGVSIVVLKVLPNSSDKPIIHFTELWGNRSEKYRELSLKTVKNTDFELIVPKEPYYFFILSDIHQNIPEWDNWLVITDIFNKKSTGTETGFDDLLIDFSKKELGEKIAFFSNLEISEEKLSKTFEFTKGHAAEIYARRREMVNVKDSEFGLFQLRAYDYRFAFLRKNLLKTNSFNVMLDLGNQSPGLVTTRQTKEAFSAFAVSSFCGHKIASSYDRSYVFPLFTEDKSRLFQIKTPCIANSVMKHFKELLWSETKYINDDTNLVLDIFGYSLAILNSPSYRNIFATYLKRDWPRLPLTQNGELFHELARIGKELMALQLLEAPILEVPISRFIGKGNNTVLSGYPKYESNKVLINPTLGFEGVPQDVWEFYIGGYQVCHKWLKDRRGRQLSEEDITHYQKIIVALKETIRIMGEIDQVIEDHGGWPIK
jgi:predicted helicase